MNVLKSIYTTAALALCVMGVSSCGNEWLDVSPSNGTDAESAINSSSDLDAARTGMYAALKGTRDFTDYYGQGFFIYGDMHAGDDYQYNNISGSNRASFFYNMNYSTASDFTRTLVPCSHPIW